MPALRLQLRLELKLQMQMRDWRAELPRVLPTLSPPARVDPLLAAAGDPLLADADAHAVAVSAAAMRKKLKKLLQSRQHLLPQLQHQHATEPSSSVTGAGQYQLQPAHCQTERIRAWKHLSRAHQQ